MRGGGENALRAELLGHSGDGWAAGSSEEIAALGGGPAAGAAGFLRHRTRFEEAGGGARALWVAGSRWDGKKSCLVVILLVTVAGTLSARGARPLPHKPLKSNDRNKGRDSSGET